MDTNQVTLKSLAQAGKVSCKRYTGNSYVDEQLPLELADLSLPPGTKYVEPQVGGGFGGAPLMVHVRCWDEPPGNPFRRVIQTISFADGRRI